MLGDIIKSFGAFKKAIKPQTKIETTTTHKVYTVSELINTLDDANSSRDDKQKANRLLNKAIKESTK